MGELFFAETLYLRFIIHVLYLPIYYSPKFSENEQNSYCVILEQKPILKHKLMKTRKIKKNMVQSKTLVMILKILLC
jgi:hypothetical protein